MPTKAPVITIAVSALLLCACSNKPACGPGNCAGCCSAAGSCELGVAISECGAAGAMCRPCPPGQQCEIGVCVFPNTGSGGGGGFGTGGGVSTGGGNGGGFGTGGGGTHRPSMVGTAVQLNDGSWLAGNLSVQQDTFDGGTSCETFINFAHYSADPYGNYHCTDSSSTGCSWEKCVNDGSLPTQTDAYAGELTFTAGAQQWMMENTATSDANGDFSVTINAGDSLTASSPGLDVPAFTAQTEMPAPLELSSPTPGQTLMVNRNDALPVSWGGAAQDVFIGLASTNPNGQVRVQFICKVQPGLSQVTVPASILSQLPAGDGYLNVSTHRVATSFAGQWPVNFITENAIGASYVPLQLQ